MTPDCLFCETRDTAEVFEGVYLRWLKLVLIEKPRVIGDLAIRKLKVTVELLELELSKCEWREPLALL